MNFIKTNLKINKNKVYKNLQINYENPSYLKAESIFESLSEIARKSIESTTMFCVKKNIFNFKENNLEECDRIILCCTTLGLNIEKEINGLIIKNQAFEAFILDGISNEVLFNMASQANIQLKKDFYDCGFGITRNYFAGESDIDIKYQKTIFDYFMKEKNIDLRLTETCMLSPQKSMLYIIGINKGESTQRLENICSKCNVKNCVYSLR